MEQESAISLVDGRKKGCLSLSIIKVTDNTRLGKAGGKEQKHYTFFLFNVLFDTGA